MELGDDRIHMYMKETLAKLRMYGFGRFATYLALELYRKIWLEGVVGSFSQNGEDLTIHKLLKNKKSGFYVDIGANDPTRFNNTKYFYQKGWSGINIEPDFNCFTKISKARQRDINLNLGIGRMSSNLVFYKFIPHTLSTFSGKEARRYLKQGYKLRGKKIVRVKKLSEVLDENIKDRKIDFMTIDTEGYDLEVLKSNDWSKYKPKVICIESVRHSIGKPKQVTSLESYLTVVGYSKILDNGLNSFYLDKRTALKG
jgi:FkbM family methyltransferase